MALYVSQETEKGIIGIWEITESIEELLELTNLSDDELKSYQNFKSENRKKQWLSVRVLLKIILGEQHSISYQENGKPIIYNSNLEISITHSGNYSGLLISKISSCGIDIELISDKLIRVKNKFLHESENALINQEKQLFQLCIIWSTKESIYKKLGQKNLIFSKEIAINEIDESNFRIIAQTNHQGILSNHIVHYQKINDYILTYVF